MAERNGASEIVASRGVPVAGGLGVFLTRWSNGRVWLSLDTDENGAVLKLPAAALPAVAAFLAPDLAAEAERLRADNARMTVALEAAREALTRHQGLTATDKPHEYTDALNGGCDPNGAWDCYREVTWTIDESDRLAMIDAALAPSLNGTTGGRASTGGERTPASAAVPAGTPAGATAAGGPALETATEAAAHA